MRSRVLTALLAVVLGVGAAHAAEDYVDGQVIVQFKDGASVSAIGMANARVKSLVAPQPGNARVAAFAERMKNFAVIDLPAGMTVAQAIASLRNNPMIAYVGPNAIARALVVPNDSQFTGLWNLNNTGQTINGTTGTVDADVDAPEAWDIETGASNQVIVAVLDSGVEYTHSDLTANMWVNPGEIAGNGVDDDGNTIIDDVYGAKFNRASGPPTGAPLDDYFHGTHVAGIIGARGNNAAGVTGVCWTVKIMALKFLDSSGNGNVAHAIEGINYAIAKGAHVLNNSWGTAFDDPALKAAIAAARAAGMVITGAAGNDNNSSTVYYPAGYDDVIAVSGTNNRDQNMLRNYGSHIDLAAPGNNVLSTSLANTYVRATGTSMSAPHVAGAAALLKARSPSLTATQIQTLLMNSVDIPSVWDTRYGIGRLNVNNALRSIGDVTPPTVSLIDPPNGLVVAGTINLSATASDNVFLNRVQFLVDGVVRSTATAPFNKNLNTANFTDGTHTITARAFDGAGNSADSSVTVQIYNNDVTLPTVTLTAPANGATVSGLVPLAATASDDGRVDRVRFFVDDVLVSSDTTSPYTGVFDSASLVNGPHTVMAKVFDLVDNASTHTVTVTVSNVDSTPPSVSITNPAQGATIGGSVVVQASASDNNVVAHVQFFIDGVIKTTDTTAPYTHNMNTNNFADGPHVILARAFDGVGNSSDSVVNVEILNNDPIPPGVGISFPAEGATLSGFVTVVATATDNVGIDRVNFRVNGVFASSDTTSPYTYVWDTTQLADGPHVLGARAFDIAGSSTTREITVIIDNTDETPPAVAITSPANGATVNGNVNVTATASDNVGVTRVNFFLDGVLKSTVTASPYVYTFNALLETEGPHILAARASDAAGNMTTSSITVTVTHTPTDFTPPTVTIIDPANGEIVSGSIAILATATDNNAVSKVEFWIDGNLAAADVSAPYSHIWAAVVPGNHTITVKAYDPDDNMGASSITVTVAAGAVQSLGSFNPVFNPSRGESVSIPLGLTQPIRVKATILDRFGVEIAVISDGDMAAGSNLTWNGRNASGETVASGAYVLMLDMDGSVQTRKIILRK